jgi:hypothetical protein
MYQIKFKFPFTSIYFEFRIYSPILVHPFEAPLCFKLCFGHGLFSSGFGKFSFEAVSESSRNRLCLNYLEIDGLFLTVLD